MSISVILVDVLPAMRKGESPQFDIAAASIPEEIILLIN